MSGSSGNSISRRWCGGVSAFAIAAALTAAGLTVPALAQDQNDEADSGRIPTVEVTAEFRRGTVQDTPIAITAVNAAMLEARSQTNVVQITAQTPNVSLRPAGSAFGSALVAYIRGIGQTDFNPSVEPGVAIYVDDVYYSTLTGNLLDLLDLDRVEVLRGPQGTLAGRNAIGGAVKLFTRKPDASGNGFFKATYGSHDRVDIVGAAGLTLVPDALYARIAGSSRTSDGYVTRLDYACANSLPAPGTAGGLPTYAPSFGCELGKEGGQAYTSGRLGLRWIVADNFEVNVAASIVNDDSESQPGVLIDVLDHTGSNFPWYSPNGPGFGADPFTCIAAGVVEPWADCAANNPSFSFTASTSVPIYFDNNANGVFDAGVDIPFDSRFETGGTYINYATYINDGRSTPDPNFQGGPAFIDVGGTPGVFDAGIDTIVPAAVNPNTGAYKPYVVPPINHLKSWDASVNLEWQVTDDISVLSVSSYRRYSNEFAEDTDGSPLAAQQLLQVLKHRQWSQELRVNASLFDGFMDITLGGFYMDQQTNEDARVDLPYVGFDFIHGPDLVPATNKAAYAHMTLHPFDQLDVSAGVRYSEDEKSYTFRRRNPDLTPVAACTTFWFWESANPANCGVFGLDLLSVKYSSERTDWRVAVSYDLSDTVMAYTQIATGYKAGGNNARPFFPTQLFAFNPETLTSYEAGFKSVWAEQLRLNLAGFWNVYKSIQLPSNTCTWAPPGQQTPCASQNNVGDAHVWGVELEAEWHPTDAMIIDASYSYLNFEYQQIAINPATGLPLTDVTIDMVPPYTPETKWSVGAQYEFSLGEFGTLTPRIDASFQDDVFADARNAPQNLIESYILANARFTVRSPDELWEAAFEVTNFTDEYYYLTLFDLTDSAAGYVHGQPGRPREWAFSIKRKF